MHGGDEESGGSAARVENPVLGTDVEYLAHQVGDVTRCQDDAQGLTVATRVTHELAIETANEVLTGGLILDGMEYVLIEE